MQGQNGSYNAAAAEHSTATVNVKHTVYHPAPTPPVDPAEQAQALARFRQLPLDQAPERSAPPKGSCVRNAPGQGGYFVGRQAELRQLARAVAAHSVVAVAATGPGGIGKTQLAAEFMHRYGRFFHGGVFWLSFAYADAVPEEVARCGGPDGLDLSPGFADWPQPEQISRVLAAWQSELPRLLVFDNCEDEALLARWLPKTGGCRVLLTSRNTAWHPELVAAGVNLAVLARAESLELLRRFLPARPADDPELHALAAELGDLPLALQLAGHYLQLYQDDPCGQPAAYLAELRRPGLLLQHPSLSQDGSLYTTGHIKHVARTFALSHARLHPEQDCLALQLLARAACFAAGESIPRDLLLGTVPPSDDPRAASDALRKLAQLGLLIRRDDGLWLHKLLAAFVREQQDEAGAVAAVEEHLYAEASRLNQAGYPAPLKVWQAHLQAVADAAAARGSEQAADLLNALGYHLDTIAAYREAQAAYSRSLALVEQAFGPEHPKVAIRVSNLGLVLLDMGDLPAAKQACERALAIDEQAFGSEHPKVAIRVNNLGGVLQAMGDLPAAQQAFERALAIDEQVFGSEHPNVATDVNNLGSVLRAMGDLPAAKQAFERALAIDEHSLGPEHPEVATDVNNLGSVLQAMGDLPAAQQACQRALAICMRVYGPKHPHTQLVADNLRILSQARPSRWQWLWRWFRRA